LNVALHRKLKPLPESKSKPVTEPSNLSGPKHQEKTDRHCPFGRTIGHYIVDFYSRGYSSLRMADSAFMRKTLKKIRKGSSLQKLGLTVPAFSDIDVHQNIDGD